MIIAALLTIAILSLFGVLHSWFHDNLLQCTGLSMSCVGSVLTIVSIHDCPKNAASILIVGVAIYAVGTARNAIMYHHIERPANAAVDREFHA